VSPRAVLDTVVKRKIPSTGYYILASVPATTTACNVVHIEVFQNACNTS
jgi:hypothetical protein